MRWMFTALVAIGWTLSGIHQAAASVDVKVFFLGGNPDRLDPEQWRVTPEGVAVIAEVARAFRAEGGGYILLSGHDQWVGREEDALLRSQRRADAVRDLLIEYGVPSSAVSTTACGWSRPLVRTQYGAPEIQNRYVLFWWERTEADVVATAKTACAPVN